MENNKCLMVGCVSFVLCLIFLIGSKPNIVMKESDDCKMVIDVLRVIVISLMISVGVCLSVFIWFYKGIDDIVTIKGDSKSY